MREESVDDWRTPTRNSSTSWGFCPTAASKSVDSMGGSSALPGGGACRRAATRGRHVHLSFPHGRPRASRLRLQRVRLPTRKNGCNDLPKKAPSVFLPPRPEPGAQDASPWFLARKLSDPDATAGRF